MQRLLTRRLSIAPHFLLLLPLPRLCFAHQLASVVPIGFVAVSPPPPSVSRLSNSSLIFALIFSSQVRALSKTLVDAQVMLEWRMYVSVLMMMEMKMMMLGVPCSLLTGWPV